MSIRNDNYDLSTALHAIEGELIESMVRNLWHHAEQVDAEQIDFTMWQAEQLKALEKYKRRNSDKLLWHFDFMRVEIEDQLRDAFRSGKFDQEQKIINAIKNGYKFRRKNKTENAKLDADFYEVNDRKLNALVEETTSNIRDAGYSILRTSEDAYRSTIFNAQVYFNTGAGSLQSALTMATVDLLSKGIQSIEYANGRRVNAQSYAEMALRTANKRAYLYGESQKRDEWDIHTVIVTRRGVACPRCQQYTGRVFVDDVFGSWRPTGPTKYPLISTAMAGGLYHPNCKDTHTTFFEGMDEDLIHPMTAEEKERATEIYELQQRQRYNERNIRKYDRLSQLSVDTAEREKYNRFRSSWIDKHTEFIAENSDVLRRNKARERFITVSNLPTTSNIHKTKKTSLKHKLPNGNGAGDSIEVIRSQQADLRDKIKAGDTSAIKDYEELVRQEKDGQMTIDINALLNILK